MLKIAIVVFREFLEMAVLIGLFSSTARNIKDFRILLSAGIMLGAFGASLIAFFTETISASLDGMGDEFFDAIIILITVALIISTLVLMQSYSAKVRARINNISEAYESSSGAKILFIILIASTIFREGSELVLILHSVTTVGNHNSVDYVNGFLLGATLGVAVGASIYFGLFKFASKYIFTISNLLLTFIAAGLAAEAARILVSIGAISFLTDTAWDTSYIVGDDSISGKMLKILIGYSAKPSYIELTFYLLTISAIMILGQVFSGKKKH